jgi:hypothetical protein
VNVVLKCMLTRRRMFSLLDYLVNRMQAGSPNAGCLCRLAQQCFSAFTSEMNHDWWYELFSQKAGPLIAPFHLLPKPPGLRTCRN